MVAGLGKKLSLNRGLTWCCVPAKGAACGLVIGLRDRELDTTAQGPAGPTPCDDPGDCPLAGNACFIRVCVEHVCGLSDAPEGTAVLSGFTQSVGYLIAAVGPFGVGLLYGATGGWTIPLSVLTLLVVPQLVTGLMIARPSYVEDQLELTATAR